MGTQEVACGWRDDNGTVSFCTKDQLIFFQVWNVESFKVKGLPKLGVDWKPNVCFNFLAVLLARLMEIVDEGLDSVAEVSYNPRRGIEISVRRVDKGEEHPVLPNWYTDQLFKGKL